MPRFCPTGLALVAALVVSSLVPLTAQARVLQHEATSFSVRAPAGAHLTFHPRTGAYTVTSDRGRVTYQRLRTGASPTRAGNFMLRRARMRALDVTRDRGSWTAQLPRRSKLLVRDTGRRELTLVLWRNARVRGSAAARRWSLPRIGRTARGGRAYSLKRGARLVAQIKRPAVRLTWKTPAENELISGNRVHLQALASRISAVDHVRFYVDGARVASEYNAPYETRIDANALAPGAHTLRAEARLGNGGSLNAVRQVRVAAPASTGPSPAPGPLFFDADFESGNVSAFRNVQAQSADRVSVVTNPGAFTGQHSARFEVRPGDQAAGGNRAEVTGPAFTEGQTVWFRQAIRLDSASALDGSWQQLVQYSTNGEGSPALALFTDDPEADGRFRFELRTGNSSRTYWRSPMLERDVWYDVAVRVHFSASESGQVSVHFGGQPQTLTDGSQQVSASTIHYGRAYYKTGIYRSPSHSGTSLAYHDRILMGNSAADVGL